VWDKIANINIDIDIRVNTAIGIKIDKPDIRSNFNIEANK